MKHPGSEPGLAQQKILKKRRKKALEDESL